MRLCALLFSAILFATSASAQPPPASAATDAQHTEKGRTDVSAQPGRSSAEDTTLNLPVSLDRIKDKLQQSEGVPVLKIDERPTFRIQIRERRQIEELLATLNFKAGPTPAGGVYMQEQQRVMFNPVDHPLMQPYAAFGQGQLLTILIENLVGHYLAGKTGDAVSKIERARAEGQARDEVRAAVGEYCNAQPNLGAGLQICSSIAR